MASPLPALVDVIAIHPACHADGGGPATRMAPRLCRALKASLEAYGHRSVSIVPINDPALGTPGHLVLGFTLSDATIHGRPVILIAATKSRADTPSGDLYPPSARALSPDDSDRQIDDVAKAFLVQFGLRA